MTCPTCVAPHLPAKEDFAPIAGTRRPWRGPGSAAGNAGTEHRIGGLEKEDVTGAVSYDAANHQRMVSLRAEKIEGIARDIPPAEVAGRRRAICWWSAGAAPTARLPPPSTKCGTPDSQVAHLHLRYLNPFPANLGRFSRYKRILVPENNMGQLRSMLRDRFLVDAVGLAKVEGRPFRVREIQEQIEIVAGRTTAMSTSAPEACTADRAARDLRR